MVENASCVSYVGPIVINQQRGGRKEFLEFTCQVIYVCQFMYSKLAFLRCILPSSMQAATPRHRDDSETVQ